ncbi:MAG: serine/threonine protein kinase [Deltaproteobacteria bacterium]|nr:serine/threonine protein kinase [Deltaproteobacteria bacterium]
MTGVLSPGTVVAGRYRSIEILEQGDMSIVARGERVGDGAPVALKVIQPELAADPELLERFRREARALESLRSEHIVRVHEVVEIEGSGPCMVMELLDGEDLDHVLDTDGPLPIGDAVAAVRQACEAIGEAHAHGIIHRDLKPGNLFRLRTDDGSMRVKVIDFGIAKAADTGEDPSLTGTGTAMGSPLYMSPEQLRAERVDARVDVWALGVTLFELLAGITPFEAPIPAMVLAAIFGKPPLPLREERPDVPPELEAIVLRCLEKDSSRRFASVSALAEALEPYA